MEPQPSNQQNIPWPWQLVLQVMVWLGPLLSKYIERLVARGGSSRALYEVTAYTASIEILDASGRSAIYTKRRRLRFLADNVTVIPDYGWGTGDTFAHHRVHPGRVLERQAVGLRHRSLIMLPEPQNRGDELTLEVRRFIKGGFTTRPRWLEAEIGQKTTRLQLSVLLPRQRRFKAKRLVNRAGNPVTPVRTQRPADGRERISATIVRPPLGELYTLEFDW